MLNKHNELLKKIGMLEVGINCLHQKVHEVDKEILQCIYHYGYSITKTGYVLGYSERAIDNRLVKIYEKLDNYI
ncbi:MAG: hypothetical protein RR543_01430 [Erysipelotrichales bacterium]